MDNTELQQHWKLSLVWVVKCNPSSAYLNMSSVRSNYECKYELHPPNHSLSSF